MKKTYCVTWIESYCCSKTVEAENEEEAIAKCQSDRTPDQKEPDGEGGHYWDAYESEEDE